MREAWATAITVLAVLYFAYGSNMDLVQMSNRCERAATVSAADLPLHRFIINSRGVATVVPDPASTVQGLLWRITKEDERSLDRHEGVVQGTYKKAFVEVSVPGGGKVRALVYVATDSTPGEARPGYMEKIVSAAEACGLPKTYVDQLKPWLR
jgi:cation transport regulator ChaC